MISFENDLQEYLMKPTQVITNELLNELYAEYELDWDGIHGFGHWCRVHDIGLCIAESNGANQKVVEYFAFFHDIKRLDEDTDKDHGRRAAEFLEQNYSGKLGLTPEEFALLVDACAGHNDGMTEADVTIQTCWDADRLELPRVGIIPNAKYLCTQEAKNPRMITWAMSRNSQLPVLYS